ncbi:MAG: glutathione peroxidase [Phycisphaerae bacterium]|nr:glutathione peroxidase [Phycisphaerae bacterium]
MGAAEPPSDRVDRAAPPGVKSKAPAEVSDAYVLGFKVKSIDGQEIDLAQYTGKVVLIVNVASKCGLTPQYEGLQKLYAEKKDRGLVVLGFPANNFMGQEPGTNREIKEFCTSTYAVTFPMFEKISVKGAEQHPLYKKLCAQPKPIGEEPDWNFAKYLVDRRGNVVARFGARTKPGDVEFVKKIDELLGSPSAATGAPASGR